MILGQDTVSNLTVLIFVLVCLMGTLEICWIDWINLSVDDVTSHPEKSRNMPLL